MLHERAPQLGGRLGTVQVGGRSVGAGCSYIKAKHPDFVEQLERWERAGLVAEWHDAHPHAVTAPGVWAPLPSEGERWFVGQPDMGAPTSLSAAEREQIEVRTGDVFDVNWEDGRWLVATQREGDEGEEGEEGEEGDEDAVPEVDDVLQGEVDSHLHGSLVVATPVHELEVFLPRKLLDTALGRGRYKDFVKER